MYKKKKSWRIVFSILIAFLLLAAVRQKGQLYNTGEIYYISAECEEKSESISELSDMIPSDYDSLMIVAHPDDETIWGGAHLLEGNYVVVCITNGNNSIRRREFENVMKETKSIGLMLNYPDKTRGKRDDWKACQGRIQEDINRIIGKKKWNTIVTHNPDGEYGHIHHQMTSRIVTAVTKEQRDEDRLYYFGKYVKKKNMDQEEYAGCLTACLSASLLEKKISVTELYPSQKKVMQHLGHMFPFENWIKADAWGK